MRRKIISLDANDRACKHGWNFTDQKKKVTQPKHRRNIQPTRARTLPGLANSCILHLGRRRRIYDDSGEHNTTTTFINQGLCQNKSASSVDSRTRSTNLASKWALLHHVLKKTSVQLPLTERTQSSALSESPQYSHDTSNLNELTTSFHQ